MICLFSHMRYEKRSRGRPRTRLPDVRKPNEFALWIYKTNSSVASIAETLNVTESIVYSWRKGVKQPSLRMAILIAEMTEGDVLPESWKEKGKE